MGTRVVAPSAPLMQVFYVVLCLAVAAVGLYLVYPDLKPRLAQAAGAPRPFANCQAANAAGYYSIPRGSRTYDARQDLDQDGFACEPEPERPRPR